MTASDHLNRQQFHTMSVGAVGKLNSGDYEGMTMAEAAGDDYARWEMDQASPKYRSGTAFEKLSASVEKHGVKEPLELHGGSYRSPPRTPLVYQGHHRYFAAYDTGQRRVPVTGAVKAAKAFTVYTPPA